MTGPRWIASLLVATVAIVLVPWGDPPPGEPAPAASTIPSDNAGAAPAERTTSATIANPFSTFQHGPDALNGAAAAPALLAEPQPLPDPPSRPPEAAAETARAAPPPQPDSSEPDPDAEN